MTTFNLACQYCDKKYHWRGEDIFADVVRHSLLLAANTHAITHHLRKIPYLGKTIISFFRELFLILVHFVLLILRLMSFCLYPLYWLLALLFE